MLKDSLLKKYLYIFLLSSVIIFISIKFIEKNEKQNYLNTYNKQTQTLNSNYLRQLYEYSNIIFLSYIVDNKDLLKILKGENSSEKKFLEIKKMFNEKYLLFRKYNIKEINVYSKALIPLYQSSYENYNKSISKNYKEILKKVKENKKELNTILISEVSSSYKIIKPVFDEDFNFIAIFEIGVDLPKLNHKIFLENNIFTEYIFKTKLLKHSMKKEFLKNYSFYDENKKYMYESSFYNNRIDFKNIKLDEGKLEKEESFTKFIYLDDILYAQSYTPLFNPISKESIGYFISTKRADNFMQIFSNYNLRIFISILVLAVFFIFNYLYKKEKENRKKSERKLLSIMRSIDKFVIIVETDLQGVTTYASEAFCRISGYKKEEVIGKPISIIRNPDISKKFFKDMWQQISNGNTWEGEMKNLDKDGNPYWERGTISPIFNQDNKIIGYRAIRVDISDEKQLEKVNTLLKNELYLKLNEIKTMDQSKIDESKVKLMSQILDAFSNEWKKPISNLLSSNLEFENRVNKAQYTKNDLKKYIVFINKEIENLAKNLDDFRKLFTKDENSDKYNVYEEIKSVCESIYEKEFRYVINADKSIETFGVSFDLKKVVSGIIFNSIDAAKNLNKSICNIEVSIEKIDKNFLIKIKDDSGGIPEKILPKIFEYNFSTKYDVKTKGLPLHIAKLIVEKSNGKIWAENYKEGCCFLIELEITDNKCILEDKS